MSLSNETNQRGLRDFLQLYNTITGYCFDKCVSNFNDRHSTQKETTCVDVCTDNYVQFNQRLMFNFMDHQERRKRELENAATELAAKEAAAAAVNQDTLTEESTVTLGNGESSPHQSESETAVTSSQNSDASSTEATLSSNSHSNISQSPSV